MSLISGNENKIFAKGDKGLVRKAQEDNHGWKLGTPNGDLFVVCDGMGGHVGGAMASSLAVDSIIGYLLQQPYSDPITALDGALQFANMQILHYAEEHPEYKGMGTTACILLLQDSGAWIAHVGDSRIYLYLGKEHQLHRITKDHSFVQTLVDAGKITDEEAEHHPNKNRIMKALGIKPELQPSFNYERKPILPKNSDIFLICSDGLSGMIPDKTIERVLGEKLTIQQKGDKLINLAMRGETVVPGGQDNCTVELIEIDKSAAKKTVFHSYNPNQTPPKKRKKGLKIGKIERILIIAILVLALGIGAMVLLKPNQKSSSGNCSSGSSTEASTPRTNKNHAGEEMQGNGNPVVGDSAADLAKAENLCKGYKKIMDSINKWDKEKNDLESNYNNLLKNNVAKDKDPRDKMKKLKEKIEYIQQKLIEPAVTERKKLVKDLKPLIEKYKLTDLEKKYNIKYN